MVFNNVVWNNSILRSSVSLNFFMVNIPRFQRHHKITHHPFSTEFWVKVKNHMISTCEWAHSGAFKQAWKTWHISISASDADCPGASCEITSDQLGLAVAVMKKKGLSHFLANAKASVVLPLLYLHDPKNDAGSSVAVPNSSLGVLPSSFSAGMFALQNCTSASCLFLAFFI